jgi:hypothetical protein
MHNPAATSQAYTFNLDRSMGLQEGTGPFTLSSPINSISNPGPYSYGSTINVTVPAQEVFLWEFSSSAP